MYVRNSFTESFDKVFTNITLISVGVFIYLTLHNTKGSKHN